MKGHAVQDKQEVLGRLQELRPQLNALGVCSLGLFGSFVRDQAHEGSDVDLLVELERRPDGAFLRLMELGQLLEERLGRRVEIVLRDALSPYIGPHIMREVEHVSLAA